MSHVVLVHVSTVSCPNVPREVAVRRQPPAHHRTAPPPPPGIVQKYIHTVHKGSSAEQVVHHQYDLLQQLGQGGGAFWRSGFQRLGLHNSQALLR